MLSALLVSATLIALLAALLAAVLSYDVGADTACERTLVERVNDLLPQTQCGRCTFAGCRPYAQAVVKGTADINQCPPGGEATVVALARLLARRSKPVAERFGVVPTEPHVAWIEESACIGCAKCILACPVDAIVGAPKFMHTVITDQCTGCELCIPPCPVDCIEMRPMADGAQTIREAVA